LNKDIGVNQGGTPAAMMALWFNSNFKSQSNDDLIVGAGELNQSWMFSIAVIA
jgi:hypothetical protein